MMRVLPDAEALARAAVELFVERAADAVRRRERFVVALAGGATPRRLYEMLADGNCRDRVSWDHVHIFWGDERCVQPDDPRSNQRMAREALLDHVPVPDGQVHPIRCAGNADEAAERYEQELRRFFQAGAERFDLVVLGMGEDGHTASLFPGTPALAERERWVVATRRDGDPFDRVTLTIPMLTAARTVLFLIAGESKREALRDIDARPAGFIRPTDGELVMLVDAAAAGVTASP